MFARSTTISLEEGAGGKESFLDPDVLDWLDGKSIHRGNTKKLLMYKQLTGKGGQDIEPPA